MQVFPTDTSPTMTALHIFNLHNPKQYKNQVLPFYLSHCCQVAILFLLECRSFFVVVLVEYKLGLFTSLVRHNEAIHLPFDGYDVTVFLLVRCEVISHQIRNFLSFSLCVCVCVCMYVCARASMLACVCVRVCVCLWSLFVVSVYIFIIVFGKNICLPVGTWIWNWKLDWNLQNKPKTKIQHKIKQHITKQKKKWAKGWLMTNG